MRPSLPFSLLLALAFAVATAAAQSHAAQGLVRTQIQGIEIPSVSGAPFTARIIVTWVEPLVGGGSLSRSYYTMVARDAQGRVRREMRGFVRADSAADPPLRSYTITDPVMGTRTTCVATTQSCASTPYSPGTQPAQDDSGGLLAANGSTISHLSLGEQTIEDLRVVGTRETAGGGSRASQRELWYSPALQIDISVTRNDPHMGQLTIEVTDLVRGDPDPSWFAVPSGQ